MTTAKLKNVHKLVGVTAEYQKLEITCHGPN